MDSLQSLHHQLRAQLAAHRADCASTPVSALRASVAGTVNLLGWLKAQRRYPQFYFRLRDKPDTLAAVGKVRSFANLDCAQDFIHTHALPLIGGLTFNRQSDFFLPRLLLQQDANRLCATLFIDNLQAADEEQQQADDVLKTFVKLTALLPVRQTAEAVGQKANQAQWCSWVAQALTKIRSGELNKAVLANQTLFKTATLLNAKDFLAESEQQNNGCYHFLFARTPAHTFLGSSPERLYRRQGTLLRTEALAGTALMSKDSEQNQIMGDWLLQDEKNVRENWLVAEGICHNLNQLANHLKIDELELKQLRQVQHLCRNISIELKPHCGDHDCLNAIHPTAAVSGLPQQAASQFLQNTENFDRTWYAGTLGFMQPDQAEFCVTIRSAFIEGNKIAVFAGAGIVEGSDPLLEWQEIERKAAGLISLLKMKKEETEH